MSETTDTRATDRADTRDSAHWKHIILKCIRSFLLILLCGALVFGYSYKEPTIAYASEVEIGVAIDEAITAALAALGIGVSATVGAPMYKTVLEHMKTSAVKTAFAGCTGAIVGGKTVYNLTTSFLTAVGNAFKTAYDSCADFQANASKWGKIDTTDINYSGSLSELFKKMGYTASANESGYKFNPTVVSYTILGTAAIGTTLTYAGHSLSSKYSGKTFMVKLDGTDYYKKEFIPMNSSTLGVILYLTYVSGSSVAHQIFIYSGQVGANLLAFDDCSTVEIPLTAPGRDVLGVDVDKWFADGVSALNNSVSDVVGRVGDAVGVTGQDGTKTIPVSIPVGSDTDVEKGRTATQESTLDKDIATDADKEKDATTNTGKDTTLPKPSALPDLSLPEIVFKEKFPFCIPWDVYRIISGFYCSKASAPHWEIPVVNKRLGWNWHIDIGFTQFEPVAVVCRWFNGAAWVFALILVTRKLIGAGGGD